MGRPGAVLAFDDEDAGFGGGVGDVLVAGFGVADTTGGESFEVLAPVAAVVQVDRAGEDDEHLGAVVDMPEVRLVGPVQPDRCVVDVNEVEGSPRAFGGVGTGVDEERKGLRGAEAPPPPPAAGRTADTLPSMPPELPRTATAPHAAAPTPRPASGAHGGHANNMTSGHRLVYGMLQTRSV